MSLWRLYCIGLQILTQMDDGLTEWWRKGATNFWELVIFIFFKLEEILKLMKVTKCVYEQIIQKNDPETLLEIQI